MVAGGRYVRMTCIHSQRVRKSCTCNLLLHGVFVVIMLDLVKSGLCNTC